MRGPSGRLDMWRRGLLGRSLALLVALALLVSLVPLVAWAAPGTPSISGQVFMPDGVTPASGITVKLWKNLSGSWSVWGTPTTTGPDGRYTFTGLMALTYKVEFRDAPGLFIPEYYNDRTSFASADTIALGATEDRTGVDATLAYACSIAGTVRDSAGTPLSGIIVNAYRHLGGSSFDMASPRSTSTAADGSYTLGGLPAGSYGLQFFSGAYAHPHYRSSNPTSGVTAIERCTPVTVTSGQLSGVDETMLENGVISGTIGSASGPVADVTVDSYRYEAGTWVHQLPARTTSSATGTFTATPLYPGRYRMLFTAPSTYPAQYHLSTLSLELAAEVLVTDGGTTLLDTWLVASDTQAPVSTVHDIPAGWSNSITPSITATDGASGSGVAGIYYRIGAGADTTYTAPFAVTGEGVMTLHYWAVDGFGNEEAPHNTATMNVDTVAPAAPGAIAVSPSGWANASSFSLTWTNPVQTASPIAGKYYKLDTAPASPTDGTYVSGATGSLSIPAPSDGTHTVYVWLVDEAGNADHANRTTATINADGTAPLAPGAITVSPSTWSNASSFSLTWTNPSQSGVAPIAGKYYKLDIAPTSPTEGTYVSGATGSLSIPAPSDGTHTVYVWLVDEAGNADHANRTTATVQADRTAPVEPADLHVTTPGGTAGPVSFAWTNPSQSGVSPIAAKYWKLDAAPTSPTDGTRVAPGDASLSGIVPSTEGSHTLYVWLEDGAGNIDEGNRASVEFRYQALAFVTSPVYRFYNLRTGTHFYTADATERDRVINTLSAIYAFEGPAYNACATEQPGTTPLYRFYNLRTGTHFYTADATERDRVINTLSAIYAFEGPAYYVVGSPSVDTRNVYRFYNTRAGTHFYTATEVERDDVIARLGWLYAYEGPAFNVPR